MMLFKLSLRNIKKSIKDYTIYFLTLVLGVAIFYVFNALDSQGVMQSVSASTREIIQLMLAMLAGVSVFVSVILGFLIVYANNFLIRRRKKEFGVYLTLGMSRGAISRILLGETVLIGVISLGVGLVIGVFASQLMSILVARMFEADMSAYTFVFSPKAAGKTMVYFGIMYLLVILFNAAAISRYKLLDLLTAGRKNEKVRMKNPVVSGVLFVISLGVFGYCYLSVLGLFGTLNRNRTLLLIFLGSAATFLFFWSLSGILLRVVQARRSFYLKDLNLFVFRQMNSRINTMVFSMTVICLMLFMTIGVLSCGVSVNQSMTAELEAMTPRDVCMTKGMEADERQSFEDAGKGIEEYLLGEGVALGEVLQEGYAEATSYVLPGLTWESTLGASKEQVMEQFPMLDWSQREELVPLSAYNRMAEVYGIPAYELEEDEYLLLCTFDSMKAIRDMALRAGAPLTIGGRQYVPRFEESQEGYLSMNSSRSLLGLYVLPDSAFEDGEFMPYSNYLAGDYGADSEEEREALEARIEAATKRTPIYVFSKIALRESSIGIGAIMTFIALYLGVIFLISSAAVLALKELSEASDNRDRYRILRELGADQGMVRGALLRQIGIFFLLPLLLAFVHAVFGVQFVNRMLVILNGGSQLGAILFTAVFIALIYGGYFWATYVGSRRIVEE
ncbi:ABC transporter permease [Candidatus Merdisoma sp. JLR.KK011]|uniref:ABC transporter permease n=1 Tax=Candidatus Merdisoma sp. JLR.KK011 TaxID=3114299 RepID=UPI002FF2C1B1